MLTEIYASHVCSELHPLLKGIGYKAFLSFCGSSLHSENRSLFFVVQKLCSEMKSHLTVKLLPVPLGAHPKVLVCSTAQTCVFLCLLWSLSGLRFSSFPCFEKWGSIVHSPVCRSPTVLIEETIVSLVHVLSTFTENQLITDAHGFSSILCPYSRCLCLY